MPPQRSIPSDLWLPELAGSSAAGGTSLDLLSELVCVFTGGTSHFCRRVQIERISNHACAHSNRRIFGGRVEREREKKKGAMSQETESMSSDHERQSEEEEAEPKG